MKYYKFLLVFFIAYWPLHASSFTDANAEETKDQAADQVMASGLDLRAIQKAFNSSLATDNIVSYDYKPEFTYKVRLRQSMSTAIVLPKGEEIAAHVLGDTEYFTFISASKGSSDNEKLLLDSNVAVIIPANPGVDTNLTIFGKSGLIYSFYLRTDSFKSEHLPHLVAYVENDDLTESIKLAASVSGNDGSRTANTTDPENELIADKNKDYLRELDDIDPTLINRNYSIVSKKNSLAPTEIFDDGKGFTYFKFGDGNLDKLEQAPAIYRVIDGYDVPVNFEVRNGYYVAKMIHPAWTLRAGKKHVCIRSKAI